MSPYKLASLSAMGRPSYKNMVAPNMYVAACYTLQVGDPPLLYFIH